VFFTELAHYVTPSIDRFNLPSGLDPTKVSFDRRVPRKPRPLGWDQGAQYNEITLPESPALLGGELYLPEAEDHLPFFLKLVQENLPHQMTGLNDLWI
jgi:hypothetical protein